MILKIHPFNRDKSCTQINENTKKLILGSFPSEELTPYKGNGVINYYYGNLSRFWKIIKNLFNLDKNFEKDVELIKKFLNDNNIGIIDIIYKCYRLNDKSSLDCELSIIELEDIPYILYNSPNINTIFTTSNFVRDILISKQIKPLINDHKINIVLDKNSRKFEKFTLFGREISLYKLKSPSKIAGFSDKELMEDYSILI